MQEGPFATSPPDHHGDVLYIQVPLRTTAELAQRHLQQEEAVWRQSARHDVVKAARSQPPRLPCTCMHGHQQLSFLNTTHASCQNHNNLTKEEGLVLLTCANRRHAGPAPKHSPGRQLLQAACC